MSRARLQRTHAVARAVLAMAGALMLPATNRAAAQTIGPAAQFPYQPGVDVQHYDISLTLPPSGNAIRAIAQITARRARTVDTLRLDLVGLTVDAVSVNGRARSARTDSTTIAVPLSANDGQQVRVSVRYHGAPSDGLIIREDSSRGWSAFGDNWPNRARFWIPSVDHPSDKATVNWHVTAPSSMAIVANGSRVSRRVLSATAAHALELDATVTGGWAVSSFAMRQPIPTYLMVIGAAQMQETALGNTACGYAANGKCVAQSVWTFSPETPTMPGNFREAGRIVETFSKLVGPFAYDRLTHVQSATRFGGMENATAIFYSDRAFRTNNVGVSLIAHETAHQWFGDAVTPQRWQDVWLSEGFATYFAALYTQRSRGDSAFLAEMRKIREQIIAAPEVATRPVVDTVGAGTPLTLLNTNSYQKGGFVLHMLRARLGDSAFFGALRAYQRQYRHRTATTDDLRRAFEQRSGQSLATFFSQWLHQPGWTDLSVTWTWKADQSALMLRVQQGAQFAPRALPLELVVRDEAGRDHLITANVEATAAQTLTIPVAGVRDIGSLSADPRVRVLGRVELLRAMP